MQAEKVGTLRFSAQQINAIEEVLVSEGAIEARIRQIAEQINEDYKDKTVVVIGILKGSVLFLTDLVKRLNVDCRLEFMAVSSYGSGTVTTGAVKIVMDTRTNIEGQHVLVKLSRPPLKQTPPNCVNLPIYLPSANSSVLL